MSVCAAAASLYLLAAAGLVCQGWADYGSRYAYLPVLVPLACLAVLLSESPRRHDR